MISSGLLSRQWILQREASKRVFMWCSYHFCSIHNGRQNLRRFWSTTKVKILTHNEGSTLLLYDHTDPVHLVSDPDHLLELYWYDVTQVYRIISCSFQVSASDIVNAEKFFGPLAHITTSQLPQSRLVSLLGETKWVDQFYILQLLSSNQRKKDIPELLW